MNSRGNPYRPISRCLVFREDLNGGPMNDLESLSKVYPKTGIGPWMALPNRKPQMAKQGHMLNCMFFCVSGCFVFNRFKQNEQSPGLTSKMTDGSVFMYVGGVAGITNMVIGICMTIGWHVLQNYEHHREDETTGIQVTSCQNMCTVHQLTMKFCICIMVVIRTPHATEHQCRMNINSERVSSLHLYLEHFIKSEQPASVT